MDEICLDKEKFDHLITTVVKKTLEHHGRTERRWITGADAMALLQVKTTKLQELRDTGKIRFSKVASRTILYDRLSINSYIEQHAKDTY